MAGENFPATWFNQTGAVPMPESAGTSRFVDSINGSDATGNGTSGNPYKTIAKVQDVTVAGDIIELRNHQGQVYTPPPGVRTINGVKFTENQGVSGQMTFVQFVAGASLTVTVSGHLIKIQYISGTSTRQNVVDAVNASAANGWLVASTTTGSTVLTGVDVAMSPIHGDSAYVNGSNQVQTVSANSIWIGGTTGGAAPGTCTPITLRTYPPDRSTYGRAIIRTRPGGIFCPGKNLAAADVGKTAATILAQGTINVITGGGTSYPNAGGVTLPGCTGTFWYTGKTGDQLTGVYSGGATQTGTTTSGAVLPSPTTATDMNALTIQGVNAVRVQGVRIDYSSGRRGVGLGIIGTSSYIDVLDCEMTANWYQNMNLDPTVAHIYVRRCWNHDVGTGAESFSSDTSTNPDAQQHDMYLEGNDVWLICCVLGDCPYGFSAQHFPSGTDHYNIHCTMFTAGKGDPPRNAGNVVVDGVNNCKIYNTILSDPYAFCFTKNTTSASSGHIASHCLMALNGADTSSHSYFGLNGGKDQTWVTDTANNKITGMPPFVNYSSRSTNPSSVALASDPGVSADTTYSPPYDFFGNTRTLFTVGAFEFVPPTVFPTAKLEIAPGSLPSDLNPSWTEITDRLRGFQIKHGRQWELDQMQTGTATFSLENFDRVLDPSYTKGPFYGGLLPYTQVRFSLTYNGTTYPLFKGFVERFPLSYAQLDAAYVDLQCVDMFAALSQATITGSFVQQLSGARITTVLQAAGWTTDQTLTGWTLGTSALGSTTKLAAVVPTNAIDAGKATQAAHVIDPAQPESALSHIQTVANSDPGMFFFNGAGQAVFLDRSRFTPTAGATTMTFTDDEAAADATHVAYRDITLAYDPDRVRNDIEIALDDGTVVSAVDTASVTQYWRQPLNLDTFLKGTAGAASEAQQLAGYLLYEFKDATLRADSITVDVWATNAWAQVLAREVGDHVTIVRTPSTHPVTASETITQESLVESIEYVGQATTDLVCTLAVSALPSTFTGWTLGTSALGSTTKLVYT